MTHHVKKGPRPKVIQVKLCFCSETRPEDDQFLSGWTLWRPTEAAMSSSSSAVTCSSCFPRSASFSLNLMAVSVNFSCVSSVPPTRAKFLPVVIRRCPSESRPTPRMAAFQWRLFLRNDCDMRDDCRTAEGKSRLISERQIAVTRAQKNCSADGAELRKLNGIRPCRCGTMADREGSHAQLTKA